MKFLKFILRSLRNANYLKGDLVIHNDKISCKSSLLKNGLKMREQLLKQWVAISYAWTTQFGYVKKIKENTFSNQSSFLLSSEFNNLYEQIYKEKLVNFSNSIVLKTVCDNIVNNFFSEDLFNGSKTMTVLVTDFFVAAENGLSKYYNFQRERKIWWMRFSANPSRYSVVPFDLCLGGKPLDEICKKSTSITIKASFPFGFVDMERISLIPIYELESLNLPYTEDSYKVSLIRSVINLDLTTTALILDASVCRTENKNSTLMLNRKLAPYQILLASLHQGNKTVDDLTLHLQDVIRKSGLRLYDKFIHTCIITELEEKLMQFDCLGIPYTLVVDKESTKSGLIKMRNRDTNLFETIHVSDIPKYLLNIFKH